MVKRKIIFISFSAFIMSCSAIGRGVLIDSILHNVHKELEQELKDENGKKKNSQSKPAIKEKAENSSEEDENEDDEEQAEES
ncbi:hypothetical protein [Borreliella bissettiae]|uniref:Conserved domain protein n=1 Tax=Borrelia bissettiae (strain DSM 17990 / CIP 109136 / DN127) TaxID=521010 RepID=G0APH8_BORBD|nr:hypothetical protein [Borreliella bissettiae]AEL19604.1 conserved domain protein [Borreliella bissettiae DN127]MCD2401446.1 hypothetical protein [Borreliella bissettiae]WKD00358.1 hypothetical protein QIA02_04765 [Borreliella bissettiae]